MCTFYLLYVEVNTLCPCVQIFFRPLTIKLAQHLHLNVHRPPPRPPRRRVRSKVAVAQVVGRAFRSSCCLLKQVGWVLT